MKKAIGIIAAMLVAGFALAEITYPVDVAGTRWAVLDMTTGQVIARNKAWPVADGGPIQGLSSNIVYLLHKTQIAPQYDTRTHTLNSIETVDAEANTITKAYQAVARPVPEVVVAAQNREMEEVKRQGISMEREAIETRLMVTALITYCIDNQALPPKIQTYAENYRNRGIKLWKNRDRVKALVLAIEAQQDYDLDEGWELTDAEQDLIDNPPPPIDPEEGP
jgi:hypothetical protein